MKTHKAQFESFVNETPVTVNARFNSKTEELDLYIEDMDENRVYVSKTSTPYYELEEQAMEIIEENINTPEVKYDLY